jgi:hypothetical protein
MLKTVTNTAVFTAIFRLRSKTMITISTSLTFISDPGHGWLRVPLTDVAALGIEETITACSFIDGRYAYLEEDCDFGRFVAACESQGIPLPEITDQYMSESFNRDLPRFGDSQFSPAFWDKVRR